MMHVTRAAVLQRWRQMIPKSVRQRVKSVTQYPVTLRIVSDARSFVAFRRIENTARRYPEDVASVPIRVRALGGHRVLIRPRTADKLAVIGTFVGRYHLPPAETAHRPAVIWDLGANIGLTVAHLAHEYPSARILGVELDDQNLAQAEQNIVPWSERCQMLRGAVWVHEGQVDYVRPAGREQAFRIGRDAPAAELGSAPAITLDRLLGMSPHAQIDYVKMDIEGAEREVLRERTRWAQSVRSIKVEVHPPYSVQECVEDLRALGFRVRMGERHPALVVGVR